MRHVFTCTYLTADSFYGRFYFFCIETCFNYEQYIAIWTHYWNYTVLFNESQADIYIVLCDLLFKERE